MEIVIRKINPSEYETVADMFNKYRLFYKQPSNIELAKSYLKERLGQNEAQVFIAISNDNLEPVGFALLYPKFSSVSAIKNWHIGDLFVEPKQRKKGVGEKLLQMGIDFAKKEEANFISLNTAKDNFTAQKLYENFGFIRQELLPQYFYYQYELKE